MGMFDRIVLEIKCPNCDKTSIIECQSKELECELNVYKKGDYIGTDKYKYLSCTADCMQPECREWLDKKLGYRSGFGFMFDVKVFLNNGIVTGEYEVFKDGELDEKEDI